MPRLAPAERRTLDLEQTSEVVRARVTAARERQLARLRGTGAYANAHMTVRHLRRLCRLEPDAVRLLDRAYEALHLSARACDRVARVAQTVADLAGAEAVAKEHVAEALSYRLHGDGLGAV